MTTSTAFFDDSLSLYHGWLPVRHQRISVWLLEKTRIPQEYYPARDVRFHLLRLHAERECLRLILRMLYQGKLRLGPRGSDRSEILQAYLRRADSVLGAHQRIATDTVLLEELRTVDCLANQKETNAVLEALANIRRQNLENLERLLILETGDFVMGDKNVVVGQGIAGRNAEISKSTFTQVEAADLSELAEELRLLLSELGSKPEDKASRSAVRNIEAAERAARAGDRASTMSRLKKAGRRALEAAEEIGTSVAAETLKRLLLGT